ncbi:cytochrome-c peroxidase [Adhaeribacter sp. BT258]|uniref:Cytochrome-c peroxidase n=1 Tax=Adhaeribacter terrigena TaxID=2793070 RepID=A0ABS1C6A6_9BACT|nr:cytochrome c peroxidase [Adhaeribacter terrigena]MBK0404904.1 cytochrome-c peroxidase [Adhaeribacter terrigena]
MKQRITFFSLLAVLAFGCKPEAETIPGTTALELNAPKSFGKPVIPADNPTTVEGVQLGRMLFYEKKLSGDNSMSCGTCHQQKHAFTDGSNAVSLGIDGKPGTRNSMSLVNMAWSTSYTWDGGAKTLEQQARIPIESQVEMHQNMQQAARKLQNSAHYPPLFRRAFGNEKITEENILKALAQFERTLISADSRYDAFKKEYDKTKDNSKAIFSDDEYKGFVLFNNHPDPNSMRGADCMHCHGGDLFTTQVITNNGLDLTFKDPGKGGITGNRFDEGKFKATTLRNIALTAPYMHDGRFKTLEEVLDHYNEHVVRNSPNLDPEISGASNNHDPVKGLGLTAREKQQIIAFLKTLTDEKFVTNPEFSDPFPNFADPSKKSK